MSAAATLTPDLPPYDGPPVLVVGNGPVGQTTALLLARWGIPSVVLDDRARRDVVGSKSICQQRDVLDIWDSVGAGRQVADEGVTWTRARTFFRDHELFCIEFADAGRSPFPPFVNISQCRTEEVLDARIAENDLVDVRWSHRVTGVRDGEDGVEVAVETPDGPQALRAPYVVACSGAHSEPIRSSLGVRFDGRSFRDHFLICDIRADLPGWEQERRFYFDPEWNPGRQVLIHPCPGSTYRIDWQVPADFDLAAEEAGGGLEARIRKIIGDRDFEIVWKSVYRFHSRCVDRMRHGRVLLAGDCAHLVAPFGARGLNSGVADAENAAWKLAFVLRGWAEDRLLDSYDAERRAAAQENLEVTTATMNFLVPQTPEARRRRTDLLERAVDEPGTQSQVDSGRLAEPFWYVDSPLTTPDPTRARATRPERGKLPPPGVGVLLPDLPVRPARPPRAGRLRELARLGVLVLVVAEEDFAIAEETAHSVLTCPLHVRSMRELTGDTALVDLLGARAGEAWVVRPDSFTAAVVPVGDRAALVGALRRLSGR